MFPPERRLSAHDLVELFAQRRVGALATVTGRGEPRVAPVDLLLLRGRLFGSTSGASWRARHLRRRPSVSASYFEGDDLAVIVHGTADLVRPGDPGFAEADRACREVYGGSVTEWSDDGLYLLVDPRQVFTRSARAAAP